MKINSSFVLRCTYCQPTIGFEDINQLREHMKTYHLSSILFCEQTTEVQELTLKHHRDFYNSTAHYKDEVAYKLCKCKNLPSKTTREKLYIHSIEASHYPLITCKACGILMEREDSKEHADSNCNPIVEGGFFLQAMQEIEAKNKLKEFKENNIKAKK